MAKRNVKTRTDLIKDVHRQTAIPLETCQEVVDTFINSLKDAISDGNKINIKDFLIIDIVHYPAMNRRNPVTGEIEMADPNICAKPRLAQSVKDSVKHLIEVE